MSRDLKNIFYKRLKDLRKSSNIHSKEIAMMLGISERAYFFYEAGSREPDIDGIILLAKLFGTSTDYLLGVTDSSITEKENEIS